MVKSNSETLEDKASSNTNYYDEALDWFFFNLPSENLGRLRPS